MALLNKKYCVYCKTLKGKSLECNVCGSTTDDVKVNKRWIVTFILCWFGGLLGMHRFYNRKYVSGLFLLLTLGGFFIGTTADFIKIVSEKFKYKGERIMFYEGVESDYGVED